MTAQHWPDHEVEGCTFSQPLRKHVSKLGVVWPSFGGFAPVFGLGAFPWFGFFRLVLAFWPVFVAFVFWGFGGLLTSLEPICHLDDIVQCLWWLISTADTCTAPERVFHTCTYFSLLDLWSEWELAGRNFSAILKEAIRSCFFVWWVFLFVFLWRFLLPVLPVFRGLFFGFPCSAVFWALFLGDSRRVWICLVTG